jgi:hypothetical protein
VTRADFTYEVRKLPTDPVWVEDYVVRTRDGESVGTVAAVLERRGERLLVVERGVVPMAQDRRVVPWAQIERIDHDALAVWLTLEERSFVEEAQQLDPGLAVEEGHAEARRIDRTPEGEVPPAQASPSGPVDRPHSRVSIFTAALAIFLFWGLAAMSLATGDAWPMLLAIVPAAVAAVAVLVAYRAYRQPYEPRGARKG